MQVYTKYYTAIIGCILTGYGFFLLYKGEDTVEDFRIFVFCIFAGAVLIGLTRIISLIEVSLVFRK